MCLYRTRLIVAESIHFSVKSETIDTVHSPAFSIYFRDILSEISGGLAPGNSMSIIWKARNIALTVFITLSAHISLMSDNVFN